MRELCSVISNDSALTLSFGIIVYHPLVRLSHPVAGVKRILARNPTNWTTGGDPVREFPPEPGYIDGPAGISNS